MASLLPKNADKAEGIQTDFVNIMVFDCFWYLIAFGRCFYLPPQR